VSKDITRILAGWEYVPDELSVRIVAGDDGREKLQLRMDLGLMQMEMDGRPDGQRPDGFPSWLECYEAHQQAAADQGDEFVLEPEQLGHLLREGVQYYHRYLSFFRLGRYDLCARDTQRNLRLFAFVRTHARNEHDRLQFDQWRPYVTMMHARAVATPLVESRRWTLALTAVDDAIAAIKEFLKEHRQTHRADQCQELAFLIKWREEINKLQSSEGAGRQEGLDRLNAELAQAIKQEDFEQAARLRDEIRKRGQGPADNG
jgi:hypothetical protein